MTQETPSRPPIGSLVASRRRRREEGADPAPRPRPPTPATGLQLALARIGEREIAGHAFDPDAPGRRLIVELLLDGEPASLQRAEHFDPALADVGDGCHGFRFSIPADLLPHLGRVGVRIANLAGSPVREIDLSAEPADAPRHPVGAVGWTGGLRLTGWVRRPAKGPAPLVEAYLDGERIAHASANAWSEVADGGDVSIEPTFALTLPRFLADGAARRIDVRQGERTLAGSPVAILAFADGLEADLSARSALRDEAARARLFDLACPDAVPFADFEAWEKRFFPVPAGPRLAKPLAIAAIGEEAAGRQTLQSPALAGHVGAILAPDGGPTRFDAGDLVRFLEGPGAACPVVVLVSAGTILRPGAAARLAAALEADPAAEIAYGDLLLEGADGTTTPLFLPAFDEERFREQASAGLAFAMKRGPAIKAARRGIADLLRLFLSPLEAGGGLSAHLHLPGAAFVLPALDLAALNEALAEATTAHLAARGIAADIHTRPEASLPAIRIRRKSAARPSITILLDTATTLDPDIPAALDALEATRRMARADLAVIAAGPDEALRERLKLDGIALFDAAQRQGYAARLGAAAEAVESEFVCFLDARLRPQGADWLEEMASRLDDPRTGAVGPLVTSPLGAVVEAGLVLRPAGHAVPAFRDRMAGDPGSGDALHVARQVSALGRACLLLRRTDFLAVGGFDPLLFPHSGGDVDLCLKLRALGRRIVLAPDAELVLDTEACEAEGPAETRLRERAERLLFARWPHAFAADAFYSPLLDRGPVPHSGLAWPPGPALARRPSLTPARHVPPGW